MSLLPWVLTLTLELSTMGGGGTADISMAFSTESLCKSFRRAIWSQLADMPGVLGDCTERAALELLAGPELESPDALRHTETPGQ